MESFAIVTIFTVLRTKYINICQECRVPNYEIAETEEKLGRELEQLLLRRPYVPSFYCVLDWHGQMQTSLQFTVRNGYLFGVWLLSFIGLRPPVVVYSRELYVLSDGATVGLDRASLPICASQVKPLHEINNGLVLVHHGLAGHSQSEYIVFQVQKLLQGGLDVIVMNARGCGNVPLTTSDSFAGDRANDIAEVISYLLQCMSKDKEKTKPIYLLGFSLGGATSLRYIGNTGIDCPLSAAACVSPPWNLEVVTDVFYLWSSLLAMALKGYILWNVDALRNGNKSKVTLKQVLACKDLHEMDELLVESYGYKSVEEYRKAVSPVHYAQNISVPTLSISAADDPVCAIEGIPHPNQRGCGLAIIITKFGGHLSFPVGIFPLSTSWTEDVVVDWFLHHDRNIREI